MRGRAEDADQTGPPGGDGGEVLPGPQHSVSAGGGGSVSYLFSHSLSPKEGFISFQYHLIRRGPNFYFQFLPHFWRTSGYFENSLRESSGGEN